MTVWYRQRVFLCMVAVAQIVVKTIVSSPIQQDHLPIQIIEIQAQNVTFLLIFRFREGVLSGSSREWYVETGLDCRLFGSVTDQALVGIESDGHLVDLVIMVWYKKEKKEGNGTTRMSLSIGPTSRNRTWAILRVVWSYNTHPDTYTHLQTEMTHRLSSRRQYHLTMGIDGRCDTKAERTLGVLQKGLDGKEQIMVEKGIHE